MTDREAQEIIRMIESHYQTDFGAQGRGLWANMLVRYPVELGMEGVTALVSYPLPANRSKPQVSDLRAIVDRMRWRERAEQPAIEEGKWGVETPEWVWVWSWARFSREPIVGVAFPQMAQFIGDDPMLSTEQYEALRDEWQAAGCPKASSPLPSVR